MKTVLAALLAASVYAQTGANTGIRGTVVDPSNATVAAASVTITHKSTGQAQTTQTDKDGTFEIRFLPVGNYEIQVEAPRFRRLVRDGISVTTNEIANVRLELALGQQAELVTVTAEADMVRRESATIVKDIEGRELENLPTSARNFTQLLLIEPGISADISEVLTNKNANISPSVNGARTTANSVVYNGIDVTNMLCCSQRSNGTRGTIDQGGGSLSRNLAPAPETLSEVKMQTSLYDASTGRNSGANVTLVGKSGTNDFHGSVYHYLQNEKLIANDFFYNRAGIDRQRLRRNEGGFTIGGPIVRNRTFFFGSYQYTRASTAYIDQASSTVRMPEALTNDRSDAGINAFARVLGVNNPADINPVSRQLLQAQYPNGTFLVPSGAGGRNCQNDEDARSCQVTTVIPATYKQDQLTFGFDHNFSSLNRLSVKGFWANQPSRDPLASGNASSLFESEEQTSQRTLSLVDTHLFGPRIVNEFRAGVFRNINNTKPVQYFTNAQFGIVNPIASERPDLSRISIEPDDVGSEFEFGTPTLDVLDVQNTFTFGNTTSFNVGKHFLKFGGEHRHTQLNGNLAEVKNGEFVFESWGNFLTLGSGDGEQIDEVSLNYGETSRAFRINDLSLFLADDWKVTPRLTLNFGLRWDYFGWPWEKNGLISNYDPEVIASGRPLSDGYVFASNYPGGILPNDQDVRRAATKSTLANNLLNFAPRFGFAWSPERTRGMVIRGGYGIYYDRPSGALVNSLRSSPPFFREQELNDASSYNSFPRDRSVFPPPNFQVSFDDGEPFLASAADPDEEFEALETQALGQRLGTPYMQQWNLTTQFPLSRSFLLDVGYVGSKGTKLMQFVNANPPLDVDTVGLLPRAGMPGGGFTTNYFEVDDDKFVPRRNPPCDLLDDPEQCVIPAELRLPILGFDEDEGLNTLLASGNSSYHSLQTSLQKRFSRGYGFKVNYTWSKSIDTFSDEGVYQAPNDQRRLFLNRGPSDFDRRHRLIFSYIWDLPLRGNRIVEGWSVSGIGTFQSGRPFTIVDEDFSGILYASTAPRPNLSPGATHMDLETSGSYSERVGSYINTAALESSGAQFGNLGRNVMRAPTQRRFDLSVRKFTRLTERFGFEIRGEFYNLTNTSNFRRPESNLSSGDFGEILRSQGGPRVIQFALKLQF